MAWWVWTLIGIYIIGFLFFFWMELMVGPVTPALALMRAVVWPVYWATGWPHGTPLRMD
jgi:hypothetical protein